jgi:hypothetical protein
VAPALCGAEGFEQFLLPNQIGLLIVAGDAGVADRRHVLVAEAQDFADVVIPHAAFAAPIRDQFPRCFPRAQGLDFNAQHLCRFPYLYEGHNNREYEEVSDLCQRKLSLGLELSISHAQEQFSKAIVLAVAALAGCSPAEPQPDVGSIDWTLSSRLAPRRPRLDLQVKSTVNDAGSPDTIHYPLKRKNYDDLILSNLLTQRLLVPVVVPALPGA